MANAAGWESEESPGKWRTITRTFRHGDQQQWWVLEIVAGPYGPNQAERAVVATTDPLTLPDLTTWYLVTNLPASALEQGNPQPLSLVALEEVIWLYGLRQWVEQSRQASQACPGLGAVSSTKRSGDPTALAVGLLCVFVLLVSQQPLLFQYNGCAAEAD